MNKEGHFFIEAWKGMAEIDSFLASQAAEAAARISERFKLKQEQSSPAIVRNHFQLEVIVRKESFSDDESEQSPCALLELSLPTRYVPASKEDYLDAVRLLREATDEAMTARPILMRVGVRFRWARRYR